MRVYLFNVFVFVMLLTQSAFAANCDLVLTSAQNDVPIGDIGAAAAEPLHENLYRRLGVSSNATDLEIRTAYRILAKLYHSDTTVFDKAQAYEAFVRIAEANAVLSDVVMREYYNLTGRIKKSQMPSAPRNIQVEGTLKESILERLRIDPKANGFGIDTREKFLIEMASSPAMQSEVVQGLMIDLINGKYPLPSDASVRRGAFYILERRQDLKIFTQYLKKRFDFTLQNHEFTFKYLPEALLYLKHHPGDLRETAIFLFTKKLITDGLLPGAKEDAIARAIKVAGVLAVAVELPHVSKLMFELAAAHTRASRSPEQRAIGNALFSR